MLLSRSVPLVNLAVLVVLVAVPCRAASPLFDSATMMPVSSIRAGMKGTCRTVFSGVEITEFNVEVLGVLPKFRQGAVVAFSGGEHLLREDALDIIKYNASLGLWSFLNTNGLLLDERKQSTHKHQTSATPNSCNPRLPAPVNISASENNFLPGLENESRFFTGDKFNAQSAPPAFLVCFQTQMS